MDPQESPLPSMVTTESQPASLEISRSSNYFSDDILGGFGQDGPTATNEDSDELFSTIPDIVPFSEPTQMFSSPVMAPGMNLCFDYNITLSGLIRTALDEMHLMVYGIDVRMP